LTLNDKLALATGTGALESRGAGGLIDQCRAARIWRCALRKRSELIHDLQPEVAT